MHSMTGFGQAPAENDRVRVTVTLRGVNHRFLDFNLRLRDDHRSLDTVIRERAGRVLFRGRVEALLDVEWLHEVPVELVVDQQRLASLESLVGDLGHLVQGGMSFGDLLRVPELIRFQATKVTWRDEDSATAIEAFDLAMEQLLEARRTEGDQLETILRKQVDEIETITAELAEHAATGPQAAAEALTRRLAELLADSAPDPARVAQEVAVLADRSDVREELDRLRSHAEHFRILMAKPGAVGKRLDFLTQEILRELNTVGSKCRDAEMTRLVLEGKVRCEQIREQVQNVE